MSRERKRKGRSGTDWSSLDLGGLDLDGLLVILGLILAVALGWAVVELLAPVLLVCAYVALVAALRRVANDRHACEGRLGRSLLWGAIWASIYTLPLAGIVALGQWIMTR